MSVTVQLTYDMGKTLGEDRIAVEGVETVRDIVARVRERFGDEAASFEKLTRVAAVSVNGVLVNHRRGMKTRVADGDTVAFVKAAAGG